MKQFMFFSMLLFSFSAQSQDLIVTSQGDSLNCKITKVKTEHIYFTFRHKEEIRNTLLPVAQIAYYQFGFYQTPEVPLHQAVGNEIYPHFRVAISGGWSYRIGKVSESVPSDFEQYIRDLKSGYHYGLDLSYYFSEQLGVGLKYNKYKSKNSADHIYVDQPDGTTQLGKMSDDISIHFIGPMLSMRLMDADKKNSFLMNVGMGHMDYKDAAVLISDFTIKGSTLGLCWDFGYDIGISENLVMGCQLSLMIGTLYQYKVSDGRHTETVKLEEEEYENLSRIDLSIGLRFVK